VKQLTNFVENEGILYPIEFQSLDFEPKRIFFVTNVPKGEIRGKHAHYKTKQYLICVKGLIQISIYNGCVWDREIIGEGEYTFIDQLLWDEQKYLTGNDILLSICSTIYDKNDYINNILEYEKIKNG